MKQREFQTTDVRHCLCNSPVERIFYSRHDVHITQAQNEDGNSQLAPKRGSGKHSVLVT